MKIEIRTAFVLELHKEVRDTWKKRIEKELPELFGVKLEKNKWYKCKEYNNLVFYCSDKQENYGMTFIDEEWSNTLWFKEYYIWTLATPNEVEEMLWKEAENRGYREGIKYRAGGNSIYTAKGKLKYGFFGGDNLHFEDSEGLIYDNGKWAEIINENKEIKETISRLEKEINQLKLKVK